MTTIFIAGILGDSHTGYGVHTQEFLAAMQRRSPCMGPPFVIKGIDLSGRLGPPERPLAGDVVIVVGRGPGAAVFDGCEARKICFAVWESDRLPDDWLEALVAADEVWAPSAWGAEVLRLNGIAAPRIHVVPEGLDPKLFNIAGPCSPLLDGVEGFKFLHVGKAEPRKGTFELLLAFDRAFDDDAPVYLVLACQNQLIPGFDTVRFIENLGLRRRRWIIPIQPLPRRQDVAALYRACDAFVAPSRAEGWGLPALEAMACGLPVALTHYSGHTAFADPDNSIAVPFRLAPIPPGALPHFFRGDGNYGQWAEPDVDRLADIMRMMRRDHEALRRRARRQAAAIGQRWTWDGAAAIACARIADLQTAPSACPGDVAAGLPARTGGYRVSRSLDHRLILDQRLIHESPGDSI
jgi:glycosyltransferase involved in cell wall biosynthesis